MIKQKKKKEERTGLPLCVEMEPLTSAREFKLLIEEQGKKIKKVKDHLNFGNKIFEEINNNLSNNTLYRKKRGEADWHYAVVAMSEPWEAIEKLTDFYNRIITTMLKMEHGISAAKYKELETLRKQCDDMITKFKIEIKCLKTDARSAFKNYLTALSQQNLPDDSNSTIAGWVLSFYFITNYCIPNAQNSQNSMEIMNSETPDQKAATLVIKHNKSGESCIRRYFQNKDVKELFKAKDFFWKALSIHAFENSEIGVARAYFGLIMIAMKNKAVIQPNCISAFWTCATQADSKLNEHLTSIVSEAEIHLSLNSGF